MKSLILLAVVLFGNTAFALSYPPLKCADVVGRYKLYRTSGQVNVQAMTFECVMDPVKGEQLKICKQSKFNADPVCTVFPINYSSESDKWQPVNAPRKAQGANGFFWSIFYPQYPWYSPSFDTWSDTADGGSILTYNLDALPPTQIKLITADLQDRRKDGWVEVVYVKE